MLGTLRFFLAIGVVMTHTKGYRFDLYYDTGIIAVCAFFFLSGFLMPATLEKNYYGQAMPYLKNRFLRIFPMYWFALSISLMILPNLPDWKGAYDFGLQPILQNIVLLGLNQWPNDTLYIGPAWTLDVELQYYLLVPLLMLIPKGLRIALMLLVGAFGIYMLMHPTGVRSVDRSFIPWSAFFFAGMLLYMQMPNATLFTSGTKIDKELGELAYPLFILHPIVIQATGIKLDFWPLMLCNSALAICVAYVAHRIVSPFIEAIRNRNRIAAQSS